MPTPPGVQERLPRYEPACSGRGVAVIRPTNRPNTIVLHVPVDTPWIDRTPPVCNLLLFDLRNFYEAAVFGVRTYTPVRGGTFENRRAKTLRAAVSVRYCVDPSESSDVDISLETKCEPPHPRGFVLSGHLSASWTLTFRRTR